MILMICVYMSFKLFLSISIIWISELFFTPCRSVFQFLTAGQLGGTVDVTFTTFVNLTCWQKRYIIRVNLGFEPTIGGFWHGKGTQRFTELRLLQRLGNVCHLCPQSAFKHGILW